MEYKKCNVVAECCCNHMGRIAVAMEMIKTAKLCGADFVKFQKRHCETAIPKHWHNKPHPNPVNAFGETYLEHRQALEFSIDQHYHLMDYAENVVSIGYSCSVWDEISAREIIELGPECIKVPSACNMNWSLLDLLYSNFDGDIHISLGMTEPQEREKIYKYLDGDIKSRTVVYWTTTEYPVPFERLYLREIENLTKIFPRVGFSGHNYGIAADIVAYTLGVEWDERHFTLDRTWKGTDQAASLEADGLRRLCRDMKAIHKVLTFKDVAITDIEKENREKLRVSES